MSAGCSVIRRSVTKPPNVRPPWLTSRSPSRLAGRTASSRPPSRTSSEAWGAANLAYGADPETVKRNVAQTTAFYTGEVPAGEAPAA